MLQSAVSCPKINLWAERLYGARVAPMDGVKGEMARRRHTSERVMNKLSEAEFAIAGVARWPNAPAALE